MEMGIGLRFWVWVVIRDSIEFPLSFLTREGRGEGSKTLSLKL